MSIKSQSKGSANAQKWDPGGIKAPILTSVTDQTESCSTAALTNSTTDSTTVGIADLNSSSQTSAEDDVNDQIEIHESHDDQPRISLIDSDGENDSQICQNESDVKFDQDHNHDDDNDSDGPILQRVDNDDDEKVEQDDHDDENNNEDVQQRQLSESDSDDEIVQEEKLDKEDIDSETSPENLKDALRLTLTLSAAEKKKRRDELYGPITISDHRVNEVLNQSTDEEEEEEDGGGVIVQEGYQFIKQFQQGTDKNQINLLKRTQKKVSSSDSIQFGDKDWVVEIETDLHHKQDLETDDFGVVPIGLSGSKNLISSDIVNSSQSSSKTTTPFSALESFALGQSKQLNQNQPSKFNSKYSESSVRDRKARILAMIRNERRENVECVSGSSRVQQQSKQGTGEDSNAETGSNSNTANGNLGSGNYTSQQQTQTQLQGQQAVSQNQNLSNISQSVLQSTNGKSSATSHKDTILSGGLSTVTPRIVTQTQTQSHLSHQQQTTLSLSTQQQDTVKQSTVTKSSSKKTDLLSVLDCMGFTPQQIEKIPKDLSVEYDSNFLSVFSAWHLQKNSNSKDSKERGGEVDDIMRLVREFHAVYRDFCQKRGDGGLANGFGSTGVHNSGQMLLENSYIQPQQHNINLLNAKPMIGSSNLNYGGNTNSSTNNILMKSSANVLNKSTMLDVFLGSLQDKENQNDRSENEITTSTDKDSNNNCETKLTQTQTNNNIPRSLKLLPTALRNNFSVRYYKVIENRSEVYDIVTRALNRKRKESLQNSESGNESPWEELPHGLGAASNFLWNLLWTWSQPKIDYSRLLIWQRVNHFPGNKHLTQKDRLKRNIERYSKQSNGNSNIGSLFRIMPQTFILPKEYVAFCQHYGQIEEKNVNYCRKEEREKLEKEVRENRSRSLSNNPHLNQPMTESEKAEQEASIQSEINSRMPNEEVLRQKAKKAQKSLNSNTNNSNYWIMKPAKSSRGRGIYVINDIGDISYGELSIIQQYISNPLLLDGLKWDMRLYVLVTSFQPQLEAYVYKSGFARFATVPYTLDDLSTLIHLTNTSIQRYSTNPISGHQGSGNQSDGSLTGSSGNNSSNNENSSNNKQNQINPNHGPALTAQDTLVGGTKIDLNTLAKKLKNQYPNIDFFRDLWPKMIDVILKSLVCAGDHIPVSVNSFEVFGYDLIFDENLNCSLIEVNSSPSLGVDHLLDEQVKAPLINDTIELVNPVSFNREAIWRVLERRVVCQKSSSGRGAHLAGSSKNQNNNLLSGNSNTVTQQLNIDLASILGMNSDMSLSSRKEKKLGNYEQIAPNTSQYNLIQKMKGQLFHTKST